MRHFEISIDIQAPPATVVGVMTDVERWPDWTTTVTSVRRLDAGPLTIGSRTAIRQPRLPPAVWTVTAIDANRGFTWITKSPGVAIAGHHIVEPTPGGCRATLSLDFSGLIGGLVARLVRGVGRTS